MRRVDIEDLANQLDEGLLAVAAGETLIVTEKWKTIAEIRPPRDFGEQAPQIASSTSLTDE